MGMNIAVGVMAVIVLGVSVWCWWMEHQGEEEDSAEQKEK